ncbi:MAG: ABC transporter permease, partial [Silicimonas sp.]|nr:ABC transporter permease [Silicimonas sp.]
ARGYGCVAQNAGDLRDGALNLSCGIRIMAVTVPRDGVISAGMRGVAADWGPFHQASKRSDIQAMTRQSAACRV